MQVKVNEKDHGKETYPRLMRNSIGCIYLLLTEDEAIYLTGSKGPVKMNMDPRVRERELTPFKGTVTLYG